MRGTDGDLVLTIRSSNLVQSLHTTYRDACASFGLWSTFVPQGGASLMTPSADATLGALLDRVAVRDEVAFRQLYELSAPKLFGLALRVLERREWAEEALQDAFLQIWRQAGDYRASLSPPAGLDGADRAQPLPGSAQASQGGAGRDARRHRR
jgi:hypothetical protein